MPSRFYALSLSFAALVGLSACAGGAASTAINPPDWFEAKRAAALAANAYPNLSEVPTADEPTRSDAQVRDLESALWKRKAVLEASPRAAPPPPAAVTQQQADTFDKGARAVIDTTRPPSETAPPSPTESVPQ